MLLQFKKICFLFTLVLITCQHTLLAQASFTAKISPASIGKNEVAELRLVVENAQQVEQITPPSLNDFIIVSGPNQESGMESNNGVTKQYIGITYLLKPKSTGKLVIAPATAKADGKTLKSKVLALTVTKNASANSAANNSSTGFGGFSPFQDEPVVQASYNDFIIKKGENLAAKISKNIFIKVAVDKQTCFIGEPIVVTYKLFTRLKSESSITKNPSFNGFSVIDLLPPGNNYYSVEKLNGRDYNVYALRKAQLYPLQAGDAALESAEVENNIHFIKEEYLRSQQNDVADIFQSFSQTSIPTEAIHDEKVTLQSKPTIITVKALPEKDKPLFFKGAVGNFTIEAALEKNIFTTDDAGKLRIAISGEGNMPMIIAPDITWPEGIENYEPTAKEQLNQLTVPVSGIKVFEYPFIISKAGKYEIPAISFSFFDVKEGQYKTVSTSLLPITVSKGTGKRPSINNGGANADKQSFLAILFSNRWLILIPIAIFILTGFFLWTQKKKKKNEVQAPVINTKEVENTQAAEKPMTEIPVNPLVLTEDKMIQQDIRGFYETLNMELRKFLSEKLQIPLETINKKNIAEEADSKGITVYTSLQIQQLLDDIEWQLYTPFAAENKMQDMYNSAAAIVRSINTTTP